MRKEAGMTVTKNTLGEKGAALPCLHCEDGFYRIRIYRDGTDTVMVCRPKRADCYPLAYYDAGKCIAVCAGADELLTDRDVQMHALRMYNSLRAKKKLADIFDAHFGIRINR